jgi:predicted nucleic acid-binding protein
MEACVVDASVMIPVFVSQPHTAIARSLLAQLEDDPPLRVLVPDLLYAECANGFWRYVQHQGYDPRVVTLHLARIRGLSLSVTPTRDLAQDALAVTITYGVSAYDACYTALAQREECTLITGDRPLIRRLTGTPVAVEWLGDL